MMWRRPPGRWGSGRRGLELWRLLVREHEAPAQPLIQRDFRKRWAHPRRCKDARELRERLSEWEVWGRELVIMKGHEIEEETKVCSLDQLIPEDSRKALGDRPEAVTYADRL